MVFACILRYAYKDHSFHYLFRALPLLILDSFCLPDVARSYTRPETFDPLQVWRCH